MADTIRIRTDLLTTLMNQAGELVLARNQTMNLLNRRLWSLIGPERVGPALDDRLKEARKILLGGIRQGSDPAVVVDEALAHLREGMQAALNIALSETPSIKKVAQHFDLITSDLQESVMRSRLQPIGSVFQKLPRIVRDLARSLGKRIRVDLVGSDVELDKSIIEGLSDPLTHLIRNSADHGIELPAERQAAGKSPEGIVTVSARHEGGLVHIVIADDGRGMDAAKLKGKAVEKGIVTEAAARVMTDAEAHELIFAPGFSTAAAVTDVSGRGVGMDVVKSNITALGGSVGLETAPGKGSRLTLKLPLTMAIMHTLVVEAAGRRYALPQSSIEEMVRIKANDVAERVEILGDSAVIRRRERLLPLVRLSALLGLQAAVVDDETGQPVPDRRQRIEDRRSKEIRAPWAVAQEDSPPLHDARSDRRVSPRSALHIVALKVGDRRFGVIVDDILDMAEIVVKPLSPLFDGTLCFSGAAIMGDGKVILTLDPAGLMEASQLDFTLVSKESALRERVGGIDGVGESQTLLLFANAADEIFAVNIDLIARIDRIGPEQVNRIGSKEFVNYHDSSLRVLRLHDFLPVRAPAVAADAPLYALVPKLVRHPMGVLATGILDIVRTNAVVDQEAVRGTGVHGAMMIEGRMVVLLNLYGLFEAAEPELHRDTTGDRGLEGKKILLAEDTAFFRTITVNYLKGQGCAVTAVRDGQEAFDLLSGGERFDLLLTD
ncbi:MAG: chemotaxis protein CheW, partial [Nitrospinae bacterium]|nr:chemotaxis protein CheW [Nitrospinota bacterium]